MPDAARLGPSAFGASLEALQKQPSQSKRTRPPNLDLSEEGAKVPLRAENPERLSKRESRLGLRGLFGRHKAGSDADRHSSAGSRGDQPYQKQGGLRASLAEISNWPYALQQREGGIGHHRSEISLSSLSQSTSGQGSPLAPSNLKHKKSASAVRGHHTLPKGSRGSLATWDPPPLFQAYPQAVKHAHLPACTASAEAVLRLQNPKGVFSSGDPSDSRTQCHDGPGEAGGEKNEKGKRRHRRNTSAGSLKLEWTSKVYVLVTSGYLLQYAGEGSFDRLPEKVLHLGRDSAAFASDVIPGRHWVLQVSSAAELDGLTVSNASSSLFSRLPFRSHERRQASNFLMVFENADDMESWIAVLRREIEALGGKKSLSETGKPKSDESVSQLRSQTSQRTLVVRDPDRFSRVLPQDTTWDQPPNLNFAESDNVREQSFDDTSTVSWVSHDGRQLDGLRDSTNRFSYISSGQRTMITSAGSSPACSPIRDSFVSHQDECRLQDLLLDDQPRPRPRPNAAAINDRRQSLQTMNLVAEMRVASAQAMRPQSTYSASFPDPAAPMASSAQPTQNFSVPNGSNKRYSIARPPNSPPTVSEEFSGSPPPAQARSGSRRPPPTAIAINSRPLSFVEDHPSPLSPPLSLTTAQEQGARSTGPGTPLMFSSWAQKSDSDRKNSNSQASVLEESPILVSRRNRSVSVNELSRFKTEMATTMPNRFSTMSADQKDGRPHDLTAISLSALQQTTADSSPRAMLSLERYSKSISPEITSILQHLPQRRRRLSLYSQSTERPVELGRPFFDSHDLPPPRRSRTPSLKPAPRSSQHLRDDSLSTTNTKRRSMSQLVVELPPPVPPPNRALPPIPKKASRTRVIEQPTMI